MSKWIVDQLLRKTLAPISRLHGALLGWCSDTSKFFSQEEFPWTRRLESHWVEIRQELDELLSAPISIPSFAQVVPGEAKIADHRWKTFMFRLYGRDFKENCERCPRTHALIKDIPDMTTAFFSILEAGNHIAAHRGPFRGVIRYHLALKIPEPSASCRIRVGDEVRGWQEGQSLLFDDTYEHEVWNDSAESRVVLFMDIKRPLPVPIKWGNDLTLWILGNLIIPRLYRSDQAIAH